LAILSEGATLACNNSQILGIPNTTTHWLGKCSSQCVVVHNEDGVFQSKGVLGQCYWPQRILLDLGVQLLMLGKVLEEGLGLINVDLKPCPY